MGQFPVALSNINPTGTRDVSTRFPDGTGNDFERFRLVKLNEQSWGLEFRESPDFEAPKDSNGDNIYEIDLSLGLVGGGLNLTSITRKPTMRIIVTDDPADNGAEGPSGQSLDEMQADIL